DASPAIAAVVDRALAFDRDRRYPDAATMRADVEALRRGEAPPFATSAPPLPARPPSSVTGTSPMPPPVATASPGAREAATFVAPAKQASNAAPGPAAPAPPTARAT